MARRVVSVVRRPVGALRKSEPALEANAFAVAEDVDLSVVLRGAAVELALAGSVPLPGGLAGVPLSSGTSAQDLRGLIESGVTVSVAAEDLDCLGLRPADLVEGVRVQDPADLATTIRNADAVLSW